MADHSDRLKSKRLSIGLDSKKLSVSSYHGDTGHKKRASTTGTLSSSRKASSAVTTPMDVESSSSELEESEVRRCLQNKLLIW